MMTFANSAMKGLYDYPQVALSVLIAVSACYAALGFAGRITEEHGRVRTAWLAGGATAIGTGIWAMHFVGMLALHLPVKMNYDWPTLLLSWLVALLLLGLAVLRGLAAQADELESGVSSRTRQLTEVNSDLTEREERLREYEKVVDCLEEMIVVVDRKYRCVLANRAFLKYRGVEREHLAGRPATEWLIPELFETVIREKIDESLEGKAVKYELRYEDPHLGERDLFLSNVPIEGSVGVDRVACILQDITDRKRAERATEDWQKRLALAEKAGLRIGLWDWSVDAGTVAWSDETYRQFGFTLDTFSGRVEQAIARIHPEDRSTVEEAIRRVMAEGQEYAVQYRVVRPDKTICWIDAYGVVVRDGPTHILGIGIDVTNLRKTEQSLQQAKMELAHMTRVASMGELAASIAHQINQPLAAIVLNESASLRWLTMQPPNLGEARDAVVRAIKEANRAGDVIARVRALLQKAPPQIEWLDLNEVIRVVLALTASELRDGMITIDTELAADLPAVRGDHVQLQQVVLNLIMNAVEAMSLVAVPRKLLIKSAPHSEGVVIQIEDSGTGLSPEEVDRIFEPFFTTKPQGVGMGLSIARSVVESHGGHLWATSGSSAGAIFQFTVPVPSP
jgi:PAS domain S-box-containing protein